MMFPCETIFFVACRSSRQSDEPGCLSNFPFRGIEGGESSRNQLCWGKDRPGLQTLDFIGLFSGSIQI